MHLQTQSSKFKASLTFRNLVQQLASAEDLNQALDMLIQQKPIKKTSNSQGNSRKTPKMVLREARRDDGRSIARVHKQTSHQKTFRLFQPFFISRFSGRFDFCYA